MGCLFSPVLLTGQGLFQMYSFLGNKDHFRCHSSWHLNERWRILPHWRFLLPFPQTLTKSSGLDSLRLFIATSVILEGSEKVLIRVNSRPKGARRHPRSPLCSASLELSSFCDLGGGSLSHLSSSVDATSRFCSPKLFSSFEVLSVPTNLVDWNQIDCFDWQGSDLLTEKVGGCGGLSVGNLHLKLWLKPIPCNSLPSQRASSVSSCFSLLAAGFEVGWNETGRPLTPGFHLHSNPAAIWGDSGLLWSHQTNVFVLSSFM